MLIFLSGLGLGIWGLIHWYGALAIRASGFASSRFNPLLWLTPPACFVLAAVLLRRYSDEFVRTDVAYLGGYVCLGAGLVTIQLWSARLVNLQLGRDSIGRGNRAAGVVACGLLVGGTLAYCGANFGDGPSFVVVLLCVGLSMGGLFCVMLMLEYLAHVSEHVTVERDTAAGLRLAGVLIGGGIILGRSVAGDWVSTAATFRDFLLLAWPVLLYAIVEPLLTRSFAATPARPHPPAGLFGIVPAALYIVWGVGCLLVVGWW